MIGDSNKKFGGGTTPRSMLYYATHIDYMFSPRVGNGDINMGYPDMVDLGYLHNCRSAIWFYQHYSGYDNANLKEFRFEFNPELEVTTTGMFHRAHFITKIVFRGGIRVTGNAGDMFGCEALKTIEGELDFTNATSFSNNNVGTFFCGALEDVTIKANSINRTLIFTSKKLTTTSIQSIIDGLNTVSTAQTITFSASLVNPLTAQQEAEIQAKGWTLAYA